MKKLLLLFSFCVILFSCTSDDNKENVSDLFRIPLIDWELTKERVLATETHTLIENTSANDIVLLQYPWIEKGDGSLKYKSDDFIETMSYGFYNKNKTLEVVTYIYTKTNIKTTDKALEFLKSKYGEYTTKTKRPDFSGFVGNSYEFKAPFGVVVLEEYTSKTNRIFFSKMEYSGKLGN